MPTRQLAVFTLLALILSVGFIALQSQSDAQTIKQKTPTYAILLVTKNKVELLEGGLRTLITPPIGDPRRPVDARQTTDDGLNLFTRPERSPGLQSLNYLATQGWRVVDTTRTDGEVRYLLQR